VPTARDDRRQLPFRPRARLLLLLGDQLIRDEGIAVFELVKNAYDADATAVEVTLEDVEDRQNGRIIIEDDGSGMDLDTITDVWLEPGTDHRADQRAAGWRTPRFGRLPLGEKGVGRFAVHKLGRRIQVITRARRQREIVVDIDWDAFGRERYLDDVLVSVRRREPRHFKAGETGTRIEISGLRSKWTRGAVRNLARNVTSIRSPFAGPSDFATSVELEPDTRWLEDILDVDVVLESAMWRSHAKIVQGELTYEYEFRPLPGFADRITARRENKRLGVVLPRELQGLEDEWDEIGPIELDVFAFDKDPTVLTYTTSDRRGFNRFLSENGGVRVYRDGMRVFDYGSPEDDWLDLGGRRVNRPTERLSNNIVIGAVELQLDESPGLVEKTNREGFVENDAYRVFRETVMFAMQQLEVERARDKKRLRDILGGRAKVKQPVVDEIGVLREKLEERGLSEDLGEHVDRIEEQFRDVRDRLMTAAGAGLSMAMVVHELEKGVAELNRAVDRSVARERIEELARHLAELVEGLGYLTRRSGMSKERASAMTRIALLNTEYRLDFHGITVTNTFSDETARDFRVKCHRRLIIASLMNAFDNSIFWLGRKGAKRKRLWVGTSEHVAAAPALVVADNGPGFMDDPESLIEPFITRRPDGMGLGLHLASEIMKVHRGRIAFPEPGEVPLPRGFSGAVVAFVFPEAEWMD
jgi:signal transduction histidine kinase